MSLLYVHRLEELISSKQLPSKAKTIATYAVSKSFFWNVKKSRQRELFSRET